MKNIIIENSSNLFKYYKDLGERTFDQLSERELFLEPGKDSNSISIIVKHLHGNMMSRWTDFLNSDGEKEWRKRDEEFEDDINSKEEMIKLWNEGWERLFSTLSSLSDDNLGDIVYIRNEGHTVQDAINRQLGHYAYHVGQIVFIGKLNKEDDWKSLSIPKNQSNQYNASKYKKEKALKHFTEEEIKKTRNH